MSRRRGVTSMLAILVFLATLPLRPTPAYAASIGVTTTTDELTTNGQCSLREAIRNANTDTAVQPDCPAGSGADTITVPAGDYRLTIGGAGNTAGDIDLAASVSLVGAGSGRTIIDGSGLTPRDRVLDVAGGVVATISGVTIRRGSTTGDGGGIRTAGMLTLGDVIVAENAAEDGGGIINEVGGTLTMAHTGIRDNTSSDDGGGFVNEGTATLTDGDVSGNASVDDAAGVRNDGTLTMTGVLVGGNIATDTSGGVENRGTLTLADSTVEGNRAEGGDGGGLQNQSGGTLTVVDSAIVRNVSGEDGGGIDFDVGDASLTNVTISGNRATGDGGGLEVSDGASVGLAHVTVADNTAAQGNGLFNDPASPAAVTLRGTLLATGPSGANCAGAPVTSAGNNLEFPGTGCGFTAVGDRRADPKLGPLADNGGATPTHALLPGSAAIDAAATAGCPSTDQRGQPRPVDGNGDGSAICDIGAFEAQPGSAEVAVRARNDPNNDDQEDEARRRRRTRNNAARGEDESRTEGNVIGVRCVASDPSPVLARGFIVEPDVLPYALIANRDEGAQKILLIRDAAKLCQHIRVGDYLEAEGEKQSEVLFHADEVDIKKR